MLSLRALLLLLAAAAQPCAVLAFTALPSLSSDAALLRQTTTRTFATLVEPGTMQDNTDDTATSTNLARMQALARQASHDETAVQRAQALMDEILQSQSGDDDDGDSDNIELYNALWETYAYGCNFPDGANIIAQQMENQPSVVNLESYAHLLDAHTQRSNLDQVKAVLELLEQQDNGLLQPDITIYNKVLRAYSKMGHADAAVELVDQLLEESGAMVDEEDDDVDDKVNYDESKRPNAKTWMYLLRALAFQGRVPEIMQQMQKSMLEGYRLYGQDDWKPNAQCYNALIRAILNSSATQKDTSTQVEGILYDMIRLYREEQEGHVNDGDEDDDNDENDLSLKSMRPNQETFQLVLQCFRGETSAGVAVKVETFLNLQRGLAESNNDPSLQPNRRTYNTAISVLSRSRDPKKAIRAERIWQAMSDADDESCSPNLITLRNIMNVCAFTRGTPEARLGAYQVAVQVFNQVRSEKDEDDSANIVVQIYQLFFKATFNLMAPSPKRNDVIQKVFHKCCQDGYVTDRIVTEIVRGDENGKLQLKFFGGFVEDAAQRLDPTWSRNVPAQ
mmetsp:Transcript_7212/g.9367  ORF Transcript_7212/g.9367 Transcript_7212/m.9367 type:complete len:563 (+) Transcript_7212:70-1758(+)